MQFAGTDRLQMVGVSSLHVWSTLAEGGSFTKNYQKSLVQKKKKRAEEYRKRRKHSQLSRPGMRDQSNDDDDDKDGADKHLVVFTLQPVLWTC